MVNYDQAESKDSVGATGSAPSIVRNAYLLKCIMEISSESDAHTTNESAARSRIGYAT